MSYRTSPYIEVEEAEQLSLILQMHCEQVIRGK